jgi:E-phenylitaconyl-CoA hydratase
VQGTVRAIWEALDMTRTMALQNGLSYTQIGNPKRGERISTYGLGRDVEIR